MAFRATASFVAPISKENPVKRVVTEGTVLDAKDPLVKKYKHLFANADEFARGVVEAATANPGELRSVPAKEEKKSDDEK